MFSKSCLTMPERKKKKVACWKSLWSILQYPSRWIHTDAASQQQNQLHPNHTTVSSITPSMKEGLKSRPLADYVVWQIRWLTGTSNLIFIVSADLEEEKAGFWKVTHLQGPQRRLRELLKEHHLYQTKQWLACIWDNFNIEIIAATLNNGCSIW